MNNINNKIQEYVVTNEEKGKTYDSIYNNWKKDDTVVMISRGIIYKRGVLVYDPVYKSSDVSGSYYAWIDWEDEPDMRNVMICNIRMFRER